MFNLYPFNHSIYNRKAGIAYRFHPILEAEYFEDSSAVNRSFVVGTDLAGSTVSGNAATAAEAALVGERLDVHHDAVITTAAAAGYAAASVLAKAWLDGQRAKVTIPPHCGLELWDVVSIVDIQANQATAYRVIGYTLEIDFKQGLYTHTLMLGNL